MRYLSVSIGAAASLAAMAYLAFHHGARQPLFPVDPLKDIFDNRALITHTMPASGPDPAVAAVFQNSPVAQKYRDMKPERSVLIYDCDQSWCEQPDFSFETMFKVAAKLANPGQPDAEGLAHAWYNSASAKDMDPGLQGAFPYSSLHQLPFQLLAVANRMDMATFDGTNWNGAEIHLAYGLTPGLGATAATDLTVILEFEIKPATRPMFQSVANIWANLSEVSAYQSVIPLRDALRASGIPLVYGDPMGIARVKLRINHDVNGPQWRLTQLLLDPASGTTFMAAPLNDQICHKIQPDSPAYMALFRAVSSAVQSGNLEYTIPAELLEDATVTYTEGGKGLSLPSGLCNPSIMARHIIALQECTMCHTIESGTHFKHLPNRMPGVATTPSSFLVGNTLHPDLIDLYYSTQKAVSPVTIPYQTYVRSSNNTCNVLGPVLAEKRMFHDVARRMLFLAAETLDRANNDKLPAAAQLSTQSIE
jgi:hypothetical protein